MSRGELFAPFYSLLIFSVFAMYGSFLLLRLRGVIDMTSSVETQDDLVLWHPELDDRNIYRIVRPDVPAKQRRALVLRSSPPVGGYLFHRRIAENIRTRQLDVKVFDEEELGGKLSPQEKMQKLREFIWSVSINDSVYIHTNFDIPSGRFRMKNNGYFRPLTIMFIRDPVVALFSSYHTIQFKKNIFLDYDNYTLDNYRKHVEDLTESFEKCTAKRGHCLKNRILQNASLARLFCRCKKSDRKFDPRHLLSIARENVVARSDDFVAIPMETPEDGIMAILQKLSPDVCQDLDGLVLSPSRVLVPPPWTKLDLPRMLPIGDLRERSGQVQMEYLLYNWFRKRYILTEDTARWLPRDTPLRVNLSAFSQKDWYSLA